MDDSQRSSYTQTQTSNLAITSLVAGILGWVLIPFFGGIVAIYYGHKAKGEIRESEGALTGNVLATIGLVLGYSSIILPVCIILFLYLFGPAIDETFREMQGTLEAGFPYP